MREPPNRRTWQRSGDRILASRPVMHHCRQFRDLQPNFNACGCSARFLLSLPAVDLKQQHARQTDNACTCREIGKPSLRVPGPNPGIWWQFGGLGFAMHPGGWAGVLQVE